MMQLAMPADVGEHEFPEARGPSWTAACATLLGLGAFAIAQPLFDVLAGHIPFLVAHQLDATDLVILAADPRSVSPEEISEIEIVETFSRGHSVYAADEVAHSESGRVQ